MSCVCWGNKCPFCGNTSRKLIHKKGFNPFVKCYVCKWCTLPYSLVLGLFTVGKR